MAEGGSFPNSQSHESLANEPSTLSSADTNPRAPKQQRDSLVTRWTTLYKDTLPSLARARSPGQSYWPVHLDHCFARIIYDAIIGNSMGDSSSDKMLPAPWTARLQPPAVKNMSSVDLKKCIAFGEGIAKGNVNLVEADRKSLEVRGKRQKGEKRALDDDGNHAEQGYAKKQKKPPTTSKPRPPSRKPITKQPSILTAFGLPSPSTSPHPTPQPPPAPIPPSLHHLITTHTPPLTPFRQRVLRSLCAIPRGSFTTYAALATHLESSPRAVGNALRNNPFAPEVPCHRVVATGGGIGGFGGEWGEGGRWCGEKVGLLRGEGVVVVGDRAGAGAGGGGGGKGGEVRVRGVVWDNWGEGEREGEEGKEEG
ncbi:hypothetical protein ACLMJK_006856 [Lecanora helva]